MAEVQHKGWWETWWGVIATTVIAGLIVWGITRHYDRPTPLPPTTTNPPSPSVPIVKTPKPTPQPPSVKVDQHGQGNGAIGGSVTLAPCSVLQNGGNNNKADVNCGPQPVEIKYAVLDVVPPQDKPFKYEKQVTVMVNAAYTPVSLGVVCNAEIEAVDARMEGASIRINERKGIDDTKKVAFAYFEGSPVTPDKPVVIDVWSNQPFSVLEVKQAKIEFH
jgi:hypothetical protein